MAAVPKKKETFPLRLGSDGLESVADLLNARPRDLAYNSAVPHKHEGRPKFDLKGSAKRLAFAVFDREMSNGGIFLKQSRQLRPQSPAVRSPLRTEFEQNRAPHLVHFGAGRLPVVFARNFGCHTLLL
jgi:hypothetical protein